MPRPLLLALLGVTLACADPAPGGPPPRPAVPVTVAEAETRRVPITLEAIGALQPVSTVAVTSRVGGELTRVLFEEGDEVEQGAPLFEIDPRPYRYALRQAQAALARSRAVARNAEEERRRYLALAPQGIVSAEQTAQRVAAAKSAAAAVREAAAAVETARLNLAYTSIRAPISGRTGFLQVTAGNLVKADDTARPLVVLRQLAPIYVSFAVPGARLPEVRRAVAERRLGVIAEVAGPAGGEFEGELAQIDNAIDPATGTVTLRALFANADRALWPGQYVTARLILDHLPSAVVVPAQAVQTGQGGEFVFVVEGETARLRPVRTGPRQGGLRVVAEGLRAGERVVTDGQFALAPGTKVSVQARPARGVGGTGR